MSNVEFETEALEGIPLNGYGSRQIIGDYAEPKMVTLLVKKGIIKNPKQAYSFLLGLSSISLIATVIVYGYFVLHIGQSSKDKSRIPTEFRDQIRAIN